MELENLKEGEFLFTLTNEGFQWKRVTKSMTKFQRNFGTGKEREEKLKKMIEEYKD